MTQTSSMILKSGDRLSDRLKTMKFKTPVSHVYNPLEYARESWKQYVEKYGKGAREVVFLGMNPGPFGMAQTGIPFGEISLVRDWMGIQAPVGKPRKEHPKRPIVGFECTRSEVSGRRLWGWAKERFQTPERFFKKYFILNYCPLVFMEDSGKNFTPDKLPKNERELLFAACDEALREMVESLHAKWVIGVGDFAYQRAKEALANAGDVKVGRILHPSPASPAANRGWAAEAEKGLSALGIAFQ